MLRVNDKIFKELAIKYNLPPNIVKLVCTQPFAYTKKVIESEDDHTDVMFKYLFRIKLKNMFKDNKNDPYSRTKSKAVKNIKNKKNEKV